VGWFNCRSFLAMRRITSSQSYSSFDWCLVKIGIIASTAYLIEPQYLRLDLSLLGFKNYLVPLVVGSAWMMISLTRSP
jgi:hypothetical protein